MNRLKWMRRASARISSLYAALARESARSGFLRFDRGPLMDGEGEGGGGGGGGSDDDDPPGLTEEKVAEMIQEKLNGLDKSLRKDLKGLNASISKITKALEGQGDDPEGDDDDPPQDPPTDPKNRKDPVTNAEIQRLQREVAKATKQLKELQDENRQAKQQAQSATKKAAIQSELAKYQWREGAAEEVFEAIEGRVRLDEDGQLVAGKEDDPIAFSEWFKAKTEGVYANLLEPKGSGGSGVSSKGGSKNSFDADAFLSKNPADITDEEAKAARRALKESGLAG